MITTTMQELDQRRNDGIDVRLLWDAADNRVVVAVDDSRTGEAFVVEVGSHSAIDVFRHPFAYAAHQKVATLPAAELAA